MAAYDRVSSELKQLYRDKGLSQQVAEKLVGQPYEITTVQQFADFFDSREQITTAYESVADWRNLGHIKSGLVGIWRIASGRVEMEAKRASERVPLTNMDEPIPEDDNESLTTRFRDLHSMDVPASWQGTDSLLGRFWRELRNRSLRKFEIKGLATLESASALNPGKQTWNLGSAFELVKKGGDGEADRQQYNTDFPWKYLMGLQVTLWTLAKAGFYDVVPPGFNRRRQR